MRNSGSFYKKSILNSAWVLTLAIAPLISGCVSATITAANALDQASTRRKVAALRAQQVEMIKNLQKKDDPLGDYLFTVANAQGWWPENRISDPLVIKEMYRKAADKGSSDAAIALGLMLFDGRGAPVSSNGVYLPWEQQNWQEGIRSIEKGMKTRCSYINPTFDATSGSGVQYLRYFSAAAEIRPAFRNGKYTSGHLVVTKDPVQEKYWADLDEKCETSKEGRVTPLAR